MAIGYGAAYTSGPEVINLLFFFSTSAIVYLLAEWIAGSDLLSGKSVNTILIYMYINGMHFMFSWAEHTKVLKPRPKTGVGPQIHIKVLTEKRSYFSAFMRQSVELSIHTFIDTTVSTGPSWRFAPRGSKLTT